MIIRPTNAAWTPPATSARLSRFLYSVERDPMALKLELVELGARDKDGQQLSLGLQLSGLVLNTPLTMKPDAIA